MFSDFFLKLRASGIPVSFKSFLILQKALYLGLISNVYEFYVGARSILVKSERYFDLYDKLFAAYFEKADEPISEGIIPDNEMAAFIEKWLENPADAAREFDIDELILKNMNPEQLLKYIQERLPDQKDNHDFDKKFTVTSAASSAGNSCSQQAGMRAGGRSTTQKALKVAGDRRFRDYTSDAPLSESTMMEALKRLRNMIPHGAYDRVDIEETIINTMKNAGDIEIVFKQSLKNRLKVVLFIDNGGASMDPYVTIVKKLFDHANSFFKELKVVYFHNVIYDKVWTDPSRIKAPVSIDALMKIDPETRLIIVGDASMSRYELLSRNGIIHVEDKADAPGLKYLKLLAGGFSHSVWLNPAPEYLWQYTDSIGIINEIFPMYDISLDGLEKAIIYLMTH